MSEFIPGVYAITRSKTVIRRLLEWECAITEGHYSNGLNYSRGFECPDNPSEDIAFRLGQINSQEELEKALSYPNSLDWPVFLKTNSTRQLFLKYRGFGEEQPFFVPHTISI